MDGKDYYARKGQGPEYYHTHINDPVALSKHRQFALALLNIEPGGFGKPTDLAVDLGSGPGTSLSVLNEILKVKNAVCVDSSYEMLSYLRFLSGSVFKNMRIETVVADLESDTISISAGSASLVNCTAVTLFVKSLDNIFSEIRRILRPQGYCAINLSVHPTSRKVLMYNYGSYNLECYIQPKRTIERLIKEHNFEIAYESNSAFKSQSCEAQLGGLFAQTQNCLLILRR